MSEPLRREQIENWVSDFVGSDAFRAFSGAVEEFAVPVLVEFLSAACDHRGVDVADVEDADLRCALLERVARLNVPASARARIPEMCAALLAQLEAEGRLGGGRQLGAFVRALGPAFQEAASGKARPFERPGSKLGRNDPCPCGSGLKYKKCCMRGGD